MNREKAKQKRGGEKERRRNRSGRNSCKAERVSLIAFIGGVFDIEKFDKLIKITYFSTY